MIAGPAALIGWGISAPQEQAAKAATLTPSQQYAQKLGRGWNLGNTFDGFNTDASQDTGETSWGNPVVTPELLKAIKSQGYQSIRIPLTLTSRLDNNNQINTKFLARYKAVVDEALNDGFYVVINVHHDSWSWLNQWQGDTENPLYKKYLTIWRQLADTFKDESDHLSFESINEPQFTTPEAQSLKSLTQLNQGFYDLIRNSGGNNATRMLILPTLNTDTTPVKLASLTQQIEGLHDQRVMATVHDYSQYVFGNNMGITGFDQNMGDGTSAKSDITRLFSALDTAFTQHGIGTYIGEYGVLGYDRGADVNEPGEVAKFNNEMGLAAKKANIALALWDNGQFFNRTTYKWNNAQFGAAMLAINRNEASATAKGYDQTYLTAKTKQTLLEMNVPTGVTLKTVSWR